MTACVLQQICQIVFFFMIMSKSVKYCLTPLSFTILSYHITIFFSRQCGILCKDSRGRT